MQSGLSQVHINHNFSIVSIMTTSAVKVYLTLWVFKWVAYFALIFHMFCVMLNTICEFSKNQTCISSNKYKQKPHVFLLLHQTLNPRLYALDPDASWNNFQYFFFSFLGRFKFVGTLPIFSNNEPLWCTIHPHVPPSCIHFHELLISHIRCTK